MRLWTDSSYPIVLSCANCLAPWVKREVCELGYKIIDEADNIVVVKGAMRDVLRLNLRLRTAHRVLVPLLRARCRHIRELYNLVASIDWENLIETESYFSVFSVVNNDTIRDTRLPSLVTKDAIVDRIRDRCGSRPDSGSDYDRGAAVFLHWERDRMIIYLDTSGAPLCKRGYRKIPGSAPMQETLAAACIDALHWDRKTPFISPMCGSGTPAIEAALAAMNRAPGSLRAHFGFMSIKGYKLMIEGEKSPRIAPRQRFGATPEQIWKEMLLEAQEQEKTEGLPPIIATDISPEAIENAKTNAYIAGVSKYIQFKACDFGDTPIPPSQTSEPFVSFSITGKEGYKARGCVFFNPEYGIRLGDPAELAPIYERIGTFMNEKCPGYTGGVLTGSPELSKMINLFYVTRIPFYNGPIDCRLFVFPGCEIKGAELSTELSPSVDK